MRRCPRCTLSTLLVACHILVALTLRPSVRFVLGQSHVDCRFSFLYPLPFGLSIITRRCRCSTLCLRQTFAYFTAGCSELQSLEATKPLPAPQAPTQSLPAQDASETASSHVVVYIVAGVIAVSSSSFPTYQSCTRAAAATVP
jgi:hypothetical protein